MGFVIVSTRTPIIFFGKPQSIHAQPLIIVMLVSTLSFCSPYDKTLLNKLREVDF